MDVLREFILRLRQALEAMTGQTPSLESVDGVAGSVDEPVLWWEQPLDLAPEAIIWVGAAQSNWARLGQLALDAAGVAQPQPEDCKATYLEILNQALSPFARAVGLHTGQEVSLLPGRETGETPAYTAISIEVRTAQEPSLFLQVCFSPALVSASAREIQESEQLSAPFNLDPLPAKAPEELTPRTLDLLLEVELPVSISFGRAHLPLKDVLKLTTGSIVELNRAIKEPVEVIVNNCVIARGEVVVMEGNFGVKIHQIVSRQERLRSLY